MFFGSLDIFLQIRLFLLAFLLNIQFLLVFMLLVAFLIIFLVIPFITAVVILFVIFVGNLRKTVGTRVKV